MGKDVEGSARGINWATVPELSTSR